ncbi:hypothetical protein [Brachybacterium alimentarium]
MCVPRALLKAAPLTLMDEPTSALDPETPPSSPTLPRGSHAPEAS